MKPKVLQHPATTAAAIPSGGGGWSRNSPAPYLFAGVALMFGMVVVAIILLACSYLESVESHSDSNHEKSRKPEQVLRPEMEPKIVVIMAGDSVPTYLAEPVSSTAAAVVRSEEQA